MIREATFGAGCFWCVEAVFDDVIGVLSVMPGYAGGTFENPSYEDVCTGKTGHIEVARVMWDDEIISFDELLEIFWFVHDPTQVDRQGEDVGSQYNSAIFYHEEEQRVLAEKYRTRLVSEEVWDETIQTQIKPISTFFPAEPYHVNYFRSNPDNPYCQSVVRPKLDKFRKVFSDKLKITA
jgi:peptide-methionine (S)-S-oxide reductase